jgi:hypothetical protein
VVIGVVRDLIVMKRVHRAYFYALANLMAGQAVAMTLWPSGLAAWPRIASALLGSHVGLCTPVHAAS